MRGPLEHGFGIAGVLAAIVGFLGTILLIALVVAVLFFLIRFLIVGTKAAQVYLDTHRAAAPVATAAAPVVDQAAAVVEPVDGTTPAPTQAAPKPRTPKAPPSRES